MYCAKAQSNVMCSFSRAKRTSLPKATSRPKGTSRSAQAEHIVPKQNALFTKCVLFWRRHPVSRLWRVGARLPLVSKLPDGFAATADRIFCAERKKPGRMKEWRLQRTKKASLLGCGGLPGISPLASRRSLAAGEQAPRRLRRGGEPMRARLAFL